MVQYMAEQLRNGLLVGFSTDELPLSRIKRIMKQDALQGAGRRMVAMNVPGFMALATKLFIGLMTQLAWECSTKPGARNTLQAKDLKAAVSKSKIFDFLIDVIDDFENQNSATAQLGGAPQARKPMPPPADKPMPLFNFVGTTAMPEFAVYS